MSRSNYMEDGGEDDFPGQNELYRANVRRSTRGRFGQARLKELRDALLALPVKELAQETFVEPPNEDHAHAVVCALGAWALQREGSPEAAAKLVPSIGDTYDPDDEDTAKALAYVGWPRLVVLEAIYENDRDTSVREGNVFRPETAAERYARVLAWVESQIV